ncbi:helix-turn-helix domain-containing protein [Cryptobacterium curtum]
MNINFDLEEYKDPMTMHDLAEVLSVSEQTARNLCRTGQVTGFKMGRRTYTTKEAVLNAVNKGAMEPCYE